MEGLAYLLLAAASSARVDVFPIGLVGLIVLLGVGLLFVEALRERRHNRENDDYSTHIDK